MEPMKSMAQFHRFGKRSSQFIPLAGSALGTLLVTATVLLVWHQYQVAIGIGAYGVAPPLDLALADWRHEAVLIALGTVSILTVYFVLFRALARQARRREEVERSLSLRNIELEDVR